MRIKDSNTLLTRRVEKILPNRGGLEKLIGTKKIKLYQGVDPTGFRLHIGHTVGLRKLQEFAEAGHTVIVLFGTGTVLVGDPSQRDSVRRIITQEEINENIKDWKNQVSKILDFERVVIKQNGEWLVPLTLKDIVRIGSNISAIQLFKREMFQRRIERGDTVWFHETMYPLLQGYDSVVMDVDLEIGGTDQEFNMLIGRELQRKMNNREKFVLTVPMIMGTDGKQMSKTSGNCVWLTDSAEDMFGKLMSIPDKQIVSYMELVTDIPLSRVKQVKDELSSREVHPMNVKKELAIEVVSQFHGRNKAQSAKNGFEQTVQHGEAPNDMKVLFLSSLPEHTTITDLLVQQGFVGSRGAAKRLVEQGGVSVNHQMIADSAIRIIQLTGVLHVGKRGWIRLVK